MRAISTFTYNPASGGIDHAGSWPTYSSIRPDGTLPIDDARAAGAAPGAGGDIPALATEVTTVESRSAYFKTADGNILCSLSGFAESSNCLVKGLGLAQGYVWFDAESGAVLGPPQGPSVAMVYEESAQLVNPGQTVYYGVKACTVKENSLTCWDATTGRGAFIQAHKITTF